MFREDTAKMVSIIIPTYNREKTLPDSIRSVLAQTYPDFELIIADDCSTDHTADVVQAIGDPRIRYICLEKNQGACAARNAGIKIAKGELIAFQDSDDTWYPQKLERLLAVMEETGADVCFHKLKRHYPDGRPETFFPEMDESRFLSHEEMCNDTLISTQTIICKRCVAEEHQFDPKVRKTQDYDWAIRASRNYSFYFLSDVLVDQFFQNDSISAKGLRTIRDTRAYFLEKYPDECKANPKFELFQNLVLARSAALLGENPKAAYKRICELRGTKSDKMKYLLSRLGLISLVYKLKGAKGGALPGAGGGKSGS